MTDQPQPPQPVEGGGVDTSTEIAQDHAEGLRILAESERRKYDSTGHYIHQLSARQFDRHADLIEALAAERDGYAENNATLIENCNALMARATKAERERDELREKVDQLVDLTEGVPQKLRELSDIQSRGGRDTSRIRNRASLLQQVRNTLREQEATHDE